MESTGCYWIAPHELLERHGLEVVLVNTHELAECPDGRKLTGGLQMDSTAAQLRVADEAYQPSRYPMARSAQPWPTRAGMLVISLLLETRGGGPCSWQSQLSQVAFPRIRRTGVRITI